MSVIRDRSVVRSSVIPSEKYCWSGSLLRLANGSTTIDRRGAAKACGIDAAVSICAVRMGGGVRPKPPRGDSENKHCPDSRRACDAGGAPTQQPPHRCEFGRGTVVNSMGFGVYFRF